MYVCMYVYIYRYMYRYMYTYMYILFGLHRSIIGAQQRKKVETHATQQPRRLNITPRCFRPVQKSAVVVRDSSSEAPVPPLVASIVIDSCKRILARLASASVDVNVSSMAVKLIDSLLSWFTWLARRRLEKQRARVLSRLWWKWAWKHIEPD